MTDRECLPLGGRSVLRLCKKERNAKTCIFTTPCPAPPRPPPPLICFFFDVLRRYLKYRGDEGTYVQKFTGVDDKIIRRANEEGVPASELSERYIQEYKTDAHGLNVMDADIHPKVTENMELIIDMVKKLVESGNAYESNVDV